MESKSTNSRPAVGETSFLSRMRSALSRRLVLVTIAMAVTIAGCAKNLATGERHLNFTSENQDVAMGQQAGQEISASNGLNSGAAFQKYVHYSE